MIKNLLVALMLMTASASAEIGQDKYMHASAGFVVYALCLVTVAVTEDMGYDLSVDKAALCMVPVIAVAAGKEMYDRQHPATHTSDIMDFAATIAVPAAMSVTLYKW